MMEIRNILDVQNLIENKIEESLTLEYKSELGKKNKEIAKDISAFANTKGGTIVYGLKEKDGIPISVSWIKEKGIKERIENISNTAIQPGITGILIDRIQNPENESESIYVVTVPESFEGPHMANHSYYKRHNYSSVPMEDSEVKDAFAKKGLRKSLLDEIHRNWKMAKGLSKWLASYIQRAESTEKPLLNKERTIIPPFSSDVWKMIVSSGQSISFGKISYELIPAYDKIEKINCLLQKMDDLEQIVKYPYSRSKPHIGTYLPVLLQDEIQDLEYRLGVIKRDIEK